MTSDQKENYDYLVKNFSQRITEEGNDIMKAGGASMLMQLRKMANHPLLLRNHFTNEKIHQMAKLIAKVRYQNNFVILGLGLWCLMPLSTIFQL
jgi:SWI/SNF-related matrix-associated actin-dependent regulator 1 of chromatin subfamily A